MDFLTGIGRYDIVALVCIAVLFMYQLYFLIRYMAGIRRRFRHKKYHRFRWKEVSDASVASTTEAANRPGVSVVICAKNEGDNLRDYLQAVLSQDYPLFEVIVVNDGSEDNTSLVLEHYQHLYPNLRLTFVPQHAIVKSTKKLALTLAAKAATYDYLLLTDADCVPQSCHWISEMMEGFADKNTEIVLGYSGYFVENRLVNRFIQYETLTTAMLYLGSAMSRHPYMGVGRNLAYRKDLFFRNGGFSGMLHERAGDDDLLINRLSTAKNTEVVVSRNSIVWSVPKRSFKEWLTQKRRHLSVSHAYHTSTKLRLTLEPLSRGLWYILLIGIAVMCSIGILKPVVAIVAATLFVIRLLLQIIIISHTAHLLGTKGFGLSVLLFDIFMPLMQLSMLAKKQNNKW